MSDYIAFLCPALDTGNQYNRTSSASWPAATAAAASASAAATLITSRGCSVDEYVGLPREHPQSYHTFMWHNLIRDIDIKPENVNMLDGNAADVDEVRVTPLSSCAPARAIKSADRSRIHAAAGVHPVRGEDQIAGRN
eukprot:SAG31_NODE_3598_length_4085_cov_4.935273_7_plen_138_part_00